MNSVIAEVLHQYNNELDKGYIDYDMIWKLCTLIVTDDNSNIFMILILPLGHRSLTEFHRKKFNVQVQCDCLLQDNKRNLCLSYD